MSGSGRSGQSPSKRWQTLVEQAAQLHASLSRRNADLAVKDSDLFTILAVFDQDLLEIEAAVVEAKGDTAMMDAAKQEPGNETLDVEALLVDVETEIGKVRVTAGGLVPQMTGQGGLEIVQDRYRDADQVIKGVPCTIAETVQLRTDVDRLIAALEAFPDVP